MGITRFSQKTSNTQAVILVSETKSERWLSWVRLFTAGIVAAALFPGWSIGPISVEALMIQVTAIAVLGGYGLFYLLLTKNRRRISKQYVYAMSVLDVVVITAIIFSTLAPGSHADEVARIGFLAYFIAIIFTAFHHRPRLAYMTGIVSIAGYAAFVGTEFILFPETHQSLYVSAGKLVALLFASALGAVVSQNNYQTVRRILSSELRFDSLAERLPEMIFSLDTKGNFVWSNKACFALLGVTRENLIGRNLRSFFARPELLKFEQGGLKGTVEVHDSRGQRKYVDCTIQKVSRGINDVSFDGLMADVTDRELAISQREEMIDRLFQYQKMESLGSLASGMAHDFNNILQTIIDLSTLVQKETGEAETRKRMDLVLETTTDARFMTSELLALGRKKLLDYRHVDLRSYFENLISQQAAQLGDKVHLSLEMCDSPLKIQGDPDYLRRVFQNLFGNARDAMPEGGDITVSCEAVRGNEGDSAGTAVIRVSDTGTGIPPEAVDKIFDPFFTTKRSGKGTGLGLALVRRIIALHNGNVAIEKTGPDGTTFKIDLPMVAADESEGDTKSIMLNRIAATILMLDDDPKIRNIMKFFLKDSGYNILEASSSDEAEALLREHVGECRLVITDWHVDGEDPHAVIDRMRAVNKDLIVFVVSGYPPAAESIGKLRIYRWFTKPYDKNSLDMEMQRALRGLPPRSS